MAPPRPGRGPPGTPPSSGGTVLALHLARAILVFLLLARHHVGAAEPAVEVDVGASLAAERPELLHGRPAADRAGRRAGGFRTCGHVMHMGPVRSIASHRPAAAHTALSQPNRIG